MNPQTSLQFAAVYAEAAIAWIETGIPQAVLWYDDEERWDFTPADEDLPPSLVAFVLQQGWDGQLSLELSTDALDDDYDSLALREEIEEQMDQEGVARALIEALIEHRERLGEEAEDGRGLDAGLLQDDEER
jgi:GNAT superfamily N-acetyltransferase